MITELTAEQESKVLEYRSRYFKQAICTERADRVRAEEAVRKLCDIFWGKRKLVEWVNNPEDGIELYKSIADIGFERLFIGNEWGRHISSMHCDIGYPLGPSLLYHLSGEIERSLTDIMTVSSHALRLYSWSNFSLYSLRNTGRLCFYTYCLDVLDAEYSDRGLKILDCYNEILASCFGVWLCSSGVILCERPLTVVVQGEKVAEVEWT